MENKETFLTKDPSLTLKKRFQFKEIKQSGKKRVFKDVIVQFIESPDKVSRLGVTAPKYTGSAVTRNRLKRVCKEFFRLEESFLNRGIWLNVIFKKKNKGYFKNFKNEELVAQLKKCTQLY